MDSRLGSVWSSQQSAFSNQRSSVGRTERSDARRLRRVSAGLTAFGPPYNSLAQSPSPLFSSPGVHAWGAVAKPAVSSPFRGLPRQPESPRPSPVPARLREKPLKGLWNPCCRPPFPGVNAWARERRCAVVWTKVHHLVSISCVSRAGRLVPRYTSHTTTGMSRSPKETITIRA
jgi:hypothetical protein